MKVEPKKCVVRDCPNWNSQGVMIGDLCSPCYYTLLGNHPEEASKFSKYRIITSITLPKNWVKE